LGRLGLTDPQVLLHAIAAEQTLVTHNGKHFESLHEAWIVWRRRWEREAAEEIGRDLSFSGHHGILIMPHLPAPTLAQLIDALAGSGEVLADRLFSWTPGLGWTALDL